MIYGCATKPHNGLFMMICATFPVRADEWLFFNDSDELCKGTITNIFNIKSNGKMIMPAGNYGVLPGIFAKPC